VFATNDAINIFFKYFFGMGNHHIKIDAAKVNLNPINKNGGIYSMAGLAITNPNPNNIGTKEAIKVSRRLKYCS
tara:strand:- start:557 stop:778 length:222 start_codon:yes stop_codon:yes gene_type:complete